MRHLQPLVALTALLVFLGCLAAADAVPVLTAHGIVEKVDKDSLTIQPRSAEGKFGKGLVLKLTGTSKITTLAPQNRAGKVVLTQKDTDAKDLQPKQPISVIYATVKDEHVLLSGVAEPLPDKK